MYEAFQPSSLSTTLTYCYRIPWNMSLSTILLIVHGTHNKPLETYLIGEWVDAVLLHLLRMSPHIPCK